MNNVLSVAILLVLCTSAFALNLAAPAVDLDIISKVNSNPKSSWKAGVNAKFANMTIAQAKSLFNFQAPADMHHHKVVSFSNNAKLRAALPDAYDTDALYPQCFVEIVNQGSCGASWAFSVIQATGNRYCIAQTKKGRKVDPHLSTQYLLSCDQRDLCCNGGYLDNAFNFIEEKGLPTAECVPFTSKDFNCPACPSKCIDGSDLQLFNVLKPNSTRIFKKAEDAMLDILTYGYVSAGMVVYQDFMQYKSGVYYHQYGSQLGMEGVRITGWGVDQSNVPYWIVANFWGHDWGMKGYAWIRRGRNDVEIEKYITAATPVDE